MIYTLHVTTKLHAISGKFFSVSKSYFFSFRLAHFWSPARDFLSIKCFCDFPLIGNIKESPASNLHCCVGLVRMLKENMGNALLAPLSNNIFNLKTAFFLSA